MSDTTIEDLAAEAAESKYHTVLEVWQKVLGAARNLETESVSPQWASRIVTSYPEIRYRDMIWYRQRYFERILEMLAILESAIADDDECLKQPTPEEDLERNTGTYLTVLLDWQKQILMWELEWNPEDEMAAVDLAVSSEIHKMFFAEQGLTAALDEIKLEFTDDHRQMFAEELRRLKEESGE